MMANDYVEVKLGSLEDCLTCPLCFDILKEATIVSTCLHTFCKKCIHQKLEDQTNCCPLCNDFLGSDPLEKLRSDNNLQDIIQKIFSSKKSRKLKSKKASTRRKKRYLSSLIVAPTTTKTGTRSGKPRGRKPNKSKEITKKLENGKDMIEAKSPPGPSPPLKRSTKPPKQRISGEQGPSQVTHTMDKPSTSLATSSKGKDKHVSWDSSGEQGPSQVAHTMDKPSTSLATSSKGKDKHVRWDSLSVLAETANRKDELKAPLLGLPAFNLETKDKLNMRRTKTVKRRAQESISDKKKNIVDLNKSLIPEDHPETTLSGVLTRSREQKFAASAANGSASDKPLRRLYPVWFTLLPFQDNEDDPYPQVPRRYIRIKDGNVPVSCVSKYLVQKLNLRNESEVEVMCCGQALVPTATMSSLVDTWVKFKSKPDGSIGQSNSDVDNFVMVLTYRRK